MPSALITGVSRTRGIAWTVAHRMAAAGWSVDATGWPAHDREQPWGAEDEPAPVGMRWQEADLADPQVPGRLVADHVERYGSVDAVIAVHARSVNQGLAQATAEELDLSFAVNTRSTILLVQAAAAARVRRVVLFTTGVHQGPMPTEIPYALSKAAIQGITATLAAALAPTRATVNCINPGPNDTGWADEQVHEMVAARMPFGRWGRPDDVADLVEFLVSERAGWITGQTIDSDGGWGLR